MLNFKLSNMLNWLGNIMLGVEHNNENEKATKLAEFVDNSTKCIWAVIGDINGNLWTDQIVITSLNNAVQKDIEIIFVVDEKTIPLDQIILNLWQSKKLKIYYHNKNLVGHYVLFDKTKIRIEELHLPGSNDKTAILFNNSVMLANRLVDDFSILLAHSKLLDKVLLEDSQNTPMFA